MLKKLHAVIRPCAKLLVLLLGMTILFSTQLQSQAPCVFTKLTPVSFPNGPADVFAFTGMLQKLPADYNTSGNKKYPLLIYFPGSGAQGRGTASDLCLLLSDQQYHPAWYIERGGSFPETFTVGGVSYSFIVMAVQYNYYNSPFHFGQQIDNLITYAEQNYRVDASRIYLTGMSAGANLVIDYVGSSQARAQRVAGVSLSSVCYPVSLLPEGPANIANANLPIWFMHCSVDATSYCEVQKADEWVAAINAQKANAARYTRLPARPASVPFPFLDSLLYCQAYSHSTWPNLYSPTADARSQTPNLYNWSLASARTGALPVTLKDFTADAVNGKVQLRWTTATEINNRSFTIERAGADQRYKSIGTVNGSGNSTSDKTYSFSDDDPPPGVSYYRLVQTDYDGAQKRSEGKWVLNKKGAGTLVVVSPNPFYENITAYVNADRAQQLAVTLTDLNGRTIGRIQKKFAEGTTEISFPGAALSKGLYLLKIKGDNISEVYKVVKK